MTKTSVAFDYDELDEETRHIVKERTGEIKSLTKRVAQDIVAIGEKLIQVKAALGHGHFEDWLRAEFEWTQRTAQRFMSVAETFKSDNLSDLDIASSALYLFASPSTPDSAREETLSRARNGETITHAKAKAIRAVHTQRPLRVVLRMVGNPAGGRADLTQTQHIGRTEHKIKDFPDLSTFAATLERGRRARSRVEKWVKTTYQRTMTLKGSHTARGVATALSAEQFLKIQAMIEFLQEVERIYNDMNDSWLDGGFDGNNPSVRRF